MHISIPTQTRAVSPAAQPFDRTLIGKLVLVFSASLFVALCAHASVLIPWTPVPFTLSDFAVVLVGLALGPATAFSALVLYLAEGSAGLPVFTPGGLGGIAQLLGPTGGFLLAYPFAAALAGAIHKALTRTFPRFPATLIAAFGASALLMTAGILWLGFELHLSPVTALQKAAIPFLPGQLVKIAAAAGIYTSIQSWRRA